MTTNRLSLAAVSLLLLAVVEGCDARQESEAMGTECSSSGPLHVAAGAGTLADPWTIESCEQLRALDVACEGHFALTRDIDCSGVDFEPLGARKAFRGTLDGRGHAITGVEISASDAAGFFASTQSAELQRFTLSVAVSGRFQTGGLVGTASYTTIREVGVEGIVTGDSSVAGLVGSAHGGEIIDSFARTDLGCGVTSPRSPKDRVMAPPTAQQDACGALIGQAIGEVRVQDSYAIAPGVSRLVGAGAPGANVEASFYDCEVGGRCDVDESGVDTSALRSVGFLERAGWDLSSVWGVRGASDYPCHRFEERCGVVRVAIDNTLEPSPGHGDYQGQVLHEITRLEIDGEGFDFYANTFVVESYPDEIEEVLQRERLEVLERDVPEADDSSPTLYLVRALPDAEPCGDELVDYLRHEEPGLDGRLVFSGVDSRSTFCTFLRLAVRGLDVDLDAPADDDTYTRGSQTDGQALARSKNVIDWTDFGMRFGVPYGIPEAWEALEAHAREPHVTMHVAGAGFAQHLDFEGEVGENFFRGSVFDGDDRHGASVAAVATAIPDNQWGVAGTAGPFVARTVLWGVKNQWHIRRAMRHARRLVGPSILTISQSVETPRRLRILRRGMSRTSSVTARRDTLIIASASNDGAQLGDSRMAEMPCEGDDVLCVGGLTTRTRTLAESSNWGGPVDLFAPYQGPGFETDRIPSDVIGVFDGTSYSAPFVAGVAALVWAADPDLDADGVVQRLRDTAWTSPEDDRVTAVVNPYAAVVASLPAAPPLVQLETTEVFEGSTIRVGELATFPGAVTVAEGSPSVTWTSDRLGVLGTTPALAWTPTALDVGRHLLELTATSGGLTTSMAFEVFVENLNAPPVIAAIHVNPGPYLPGVQAVLSSDVTDADGDALTYAWSASDVPYPYEWRALGSDTTVTTTDLTALTYTWVRLVVTDSVGNQTEYIEPLAAINPGSPSIGSAVVTYEGIDEFGLTILRVEATALDPEEGAVADRRFRWYFDAPAFRGRTYSGNNGRFYIVLTTPFCEDIPVVTVTARDSAGNTAARRAIVEGCDV